MVTAGETIVVWMERQCTAHKVWYQWRYLLRTPQGEIRKES